MKALTFIYHYHSIAEDEQVQAPIYNGQELIHPSGETYWWLKLGDVVHLLDDHARFLDFASTWIALNYNLPQTSTIV